MKYFKINGQAMDINDVPSYLKNNLEETLEFKMQSRPVKEAGEVDGLQIDDLIQYCVYSLEKLNSETPSKRTQFAIRELNDALAALEERTEDRKERGVEGTSQQ